MKRYLSFILQLFFFPVLASVPFSDTKANYPAKNSGLGFTENKGQITDYNNKVREDVLFSGAVRDMSYYLRQNGVSYQLYKIDAWKSIERTRESEKISAFNKRNSIPDKLTICRLDVNWMNCNKKITISKEKQREGYDNYYLQSIPAEALFVKTYEKLIYDNIYDGVDMVWYQKDGELKYDYLIGARANYKQIQLQIVGAEKISVTSQGELILSTSIGNIVEQAPFVLQDGIELKSKWVVDKDIVSFEIKDIDPKKPFIIDPGVRTWGTYYGGTGSDYGVSCCTDKNNNVFFAGSAYNYGNNIISTPGGFQVSSPSWSNFLVKFNSSGQRLWGTYYAGGVAPFYELSCSADQSGNVFMTGATNYTANISTVNSHQSNYAGGGSDAYLIKFDASGIRLWGTYYGGAQDDRCYSCSTDISGNVYLAGFSNSTTNISSSGSHQPAFSGGTYDAFLVKFNSSGQRQWGTYYGGYETEWGYSCSTDGFGNIYLAGATRTDGGTIIATVGSHQASLALNGYEDAFLVKFNSAGQRQWGTYYGGTGIESNTYCATDTLGNIFLFGSTTTFTGTSIATPGSHQPSHGGGGLDAFLAKFDPSGTRQWGTYYGGSNWDVGWYCATDKKGNVYVTGSTNSNTGTVIATPGTQQTSCNGNEDVFLVSFGPTGQRHWGTYYGGPGHDNGSACAVDNNGSVYISSITDQDVGNSLATSGSQQTIYGGSADAIFAQFDNCTATAPLDVTPNSNLYVCANSNAVLFASGTGTIEWFATATSTPVIATGSVFTTPILNVGTYTFFVGSSLSCGRSYERTAITITVSNVLPTIQIASTSTLICAGEAINLSSSGALSYTWTPGGIGATISVLPGVTTNYLVAGTASNGCSNTASILIQVNPQPVLTVNLLPNALCSGRSATLNAIGANSYTWLPVAYLGSSLVTTPVTDLHYVLIGMDVNGCKDTLDLNLPVTPTPTLNATSFYYLCSGIAPLQVSGAETYTWNPGNLTGSSVSVSPIVTTNYTIVGSNKNCTNTAISTVSIGIAPPLVITSSVTEGCKGTCFAFTCDSSLFYPFTFFWGDSSKSSVSLSSHCYTVSGEYPVTAQAIYTSGCHVSSADTIRIKVFPLPVPLFEINDGAPVNVLKPTMFQNISKGAQKFEWFFGDAPNQTTLAKTDVNHTYSKPGKYCVKLLAIDTITTCYDSLTKCVEVLCPGEINIPNVFTPNNDGANDIFRFTTSCIKSLNCTIYNRWGKRLYFWEGIDGGWEGQTEMKLPASDGTYFFILEYTEENNGTKRKSGTVLLVR